MSRIDPGPANADQLAQLIFDDVLVPLAQRRRQARHPAAFAAGPDTELSSYFTAVQTTALTVHELALDAGTVDGVLRELEAHWRHTGQVELTVLLPRLRELAQALQSERRPDDGRVDILCYTLF